MCDFLKTGVLSPGYFENKEFERKLNWDRVVWIFNGGRGVGFGSTIVQFGIYIQYGNEIRTLVGCLTNNLSRLCKHIRDHKGMYTESLKLTNLKTQN